MGFGAERGSPEVKIISVEPVDRRREQRMRLVRRAVALVVVAVAAVALAGPIGELFEDESTDEPVRAVVSEPGPGT